MVGVVLNPNLLTTGPHSPFLYALCSPPRPPGMYCVPYKFQNESQVYVPFLQELFLHSSVTGLWACLIMRGNSFEIALMHNKIKNFYGVDDR